MVKGFNPSLISRLFLYAPSRAAASETLGVLPNPISRLLPLMVVLWSHLRDPFGYTRRKRPVPPPSWYLPAAKLPLILDAVSFLVDL